MSVAPANHPARIGSGDVCLPMVPGPAKAVCDHNTSVRVDIRYGGAQHRGGNEDSFVASGPSFRAVVLWVWRKNLGEIPQPCLSFKVSGQLWARRTLSARLLCRVVVMGRNTIPKAKGATKGAASLPSDGELSSATSDTLLETGGLQRHITNVTDAMLQNPVLEKVNESIAGIIEDLPLPELPGPADINAALTSSLRLALSSEQGRVGQALPVLKPRCLPPSSHAIKRASYASRHLIAHRWPEATDDVGPPGLLTLLTYSSSCLAPSARPRR